MTHRNNSNDTSRDNINQVEENEEQDQGLQKMNVNPNPRANENVKNIPFEKETEKTGVGSEITDGEAG